MSVLEIDRMKGKDSLTDARQSLWYSRDQRDEDATIRLSVAAPSKKRGRSLQIKGATLNTGLRPIPDSATVTVNSRKVVAAERTNHVIDIVVTDDSRELERYVIVARVSQLADHPRLGDQLKTLQSIAKMQPVKALTFVDNVDAPLKMFRAFASPYRPSRYRLSSVWRTASFVPKIDFAGGHLPV